MTRLLVALVVLLSVSDSFIEAQSDEIFFPGPTDRPSRFPRTTTTRFPTRRPTDTTSRFTTDPTSRFPTDSTNKTPTNPNTGVPTQSPWDNTTPNPQDYNTCINNCQVTSEYNPVCGTDGVVYNNPGSLGCANRCGNPVEIAGYGQCSSNSRG